MVTAEFVSRGHPDKVCDQISDAVLDAYLEKDTDAKTAIETLATGNTIILAGEINSRAKIDHEKIVREVLKDIGYTDRKYGLDYREVKIQNLLIEQSQEIRQGVDTGGAGDQGIMYGYATDETPELLPLVYVLARRIITALEEQKKRDANFGPDAKAQVTLQNGKTTKIVVAQQHIQGDIREEIEEIIRRELKEHITQETNIIINGTGAFTIGGPVADCGLTGRKTQVDTYGTQVSHGGGAFSGKDPSKVDRSAAYYARKVACEEVRKRGGDCLVRAAYAIGKSEPCEVSIEGCESIEYDFRPKNIIRELDLKKPQFYQTAQSGHFGRGFAWD